MSACSRQINPPPPTKRQKNISLPVTSIFYLFFHRQLFWLLGGIFCMCFGGVATRLGGYLIHLHEPYLPRISHPCCLHLQPSPTSSHRKINPADRQPSKATGDIRPLIGSSNPLLSLLLITSAKPETPSHAEAGGLVQGNLHVRKWDKAFFFYSLANETVLRKHHN